MVAITVAHPLIARFFFAVDVPDGADWGTEVDTGALLGDVRVGKKVSPQQSTVSNDAFENPY